MHKKIKVAVVGARGYSGVELVRLLADHPYATISGLYASVAWNPADELDLSVLQNVPVTPVEKLLSHSHDVVFLATPPEVSLELAPALLKQGMNVVDLSGAFRLQQGDTKARYNEWYKMNHDSPVELAEAFYGLMPFAAPKAVAGKAWLVSNPGCYATAVAMAVLPLLQADLIDPHSLVIDAKSGTTGAGKKAQDSLLHAEVSDDCAPYKVGGHQHYPEIVETCQRFANVTPDLAFTTHLLPIRRGILASCYAKTRPGVTTSDVQNAFEKAYKDYPLAKHAPMVSGRSSLVRLPRVAGTPRTHIAYSVDNGRLYLFSALDNLMKGAASQAVENFNVFNGWPVQTGLMGQGEQQ